MSPNLTKIWKCKKLMKGLKHSFLLKWAKTPCFVAWLENHQESLGYLSEYCGRFYVGTAPNCEIIYENGDFYKGSLSQGRKHGVGIYLNHDYKYEGEWVNDIVLDI